MPGHRSRTGCCPPGPGRSRGSCSRNRSARPSLVIWPPRCLWRSSAPSVPTLRRRNWPRNGCRPGTPSCARPRRPVCGRSGSWPAARHRRPRLRSPGCCAPQPTWTACPTPWPRYPGAPGSRRACAVMRSSTGALPARSPRRTGYPGPGLAVLRLFQAGGRAGPASGPGGARHPVRAAARLRRHPGDDGRRRRMHGGRAARCRWGRCWTGTGCPPGTWRFRRRR